MRASAWAVGSWLLTFATSAAAYAGPWAQVGDVQTRSDVEMAAAVGLLNNVTMQWPLPWTGILGQLQDAQRIDALPDGVRAAAERLVDKGKSELNPYRAHAWVEVDGASDPATVRGYDALGRSTVQGSVGYEYMSRSTAVHLSVGTQKSSGSDRQSLVFDDSYFAKRLGDVIVYAGYVQHWWGPGWISALQLSSNARPMPQIGFSRVSTRQSDSMLLRWLGPWQFIGFVGVLDGPRQAENTAYIAARFAFNPVPGLEIAVSRTTEMCGSGHKCSPLVDYFTFSNDPTHANRTNDQGSIDLRYTNTLLSRPFAVYAQFMNEDSNPLINSDTSRLYGGSVWFSLWSLNSRLTVEYANSIATKDLWGGSTQHGSAYNNYQYTDGMRYRGRSLGFSLDSDSVLYSIQAAVVDRDRWTYSLTYHRALVSHPENKLGNAVTASPVRFNLVEARIGIPLQWNLYHTSINAAVRWQDDRARPEHGQQATFELKWKFNL